MRYEQTVHCQELTIERKRQQTVGEVVAVAVWRKFTAYQKNEFHDVETFK